MKQSLIILLLSFVVISSVFSQGWRKNEMEIKVILSEKNHSQELYNLKLNGDFYQEYAVLYVTPAELVKIQSLGVEYEVTIPNLINHYKDFWSNKETYHSYDDIIASMNNLSANYPNICRKVDFGISVGGNELTALVISDNVNTAENEAEIIFDGGIHGDEIIASEIVIRLAEDLCSGYGTDPIITDLVDDREIWLYCMVNPDGRINVSRYNNNGVDCNRDAGYMWNGEGSSSGAFSQNESIALRDCMYNNQFVIHTTYHSGTEYISLPWSYRSSVCPDFGYIQTLAQQYVDASTYPTMEYGQGNTGMYPINGSTKDTNYGMMGSVTWSMEVSYEKNLPASQIIQYYNYNYPAMLSMIEHAGYGIEGVVTDAVTGDPVNAVVFVGDNFPTYTDPDFGDFHKYLTTGTYSVKIVANGYETQTINDISVTEGELTSVDFELTPIDGNVFYAYKVASSQIPDNNEDDEGYTPALFGEPDAINYSIGKAGWIVANMQNPIYDGPGNDFVIYEGDSSPEGYSCYIGETADGPWNMVGTSEGTTEFDIAGALVYGQFIKIVDDGDGSQNVADAGFDLDAVQSLEHESGTYLSMIEYYIDDSATGNNDGDLDAGETADLIITLRNNGDISALNTTAVLSVSDNYISVTSANADYGDIEEASTSVGTFTVEADESTPVGHVCNLDLSVTANSGAVNDNFDINLVIGLIIEDWESAGFDEYYWNFSGAENWETTDFLPYQGTYCSQSGDIADNQISDLYNTAMVVTAGEISFARKVSSESGWDFMKFYIDGTEIASWSGTVDWAETSYNVDAGLHTFKWSYIKDGSVSSGSDCGWIDNIVFPPSIFLWAEAGNNQTINFDETCSLSATAINQTSAEWTCSGTGFFENENNLSTIYYPSPEDIENEEVTIQLTIFDDNDNSFEDEILLSITPNNVNIKEQKQEEYSIYPNPNKGGFYLRYSNMSSEEVSIKLFNILGNELFSNKYYLNLSTNSRFINFNSLSKGIYFIEIQSNNQSVTEKLIIQ